VQNQHDVFEDVLGEVIKDALQRIDITVEALAEKVDVTERYMYRIINEGQKPSYEVLCRIIRELSIPADLIFYPEKRTKESEIDDLVHQMYRCDKRSMAIIKSTIRVALESQTMC